MRGNIMVKMINGLFGNDMWVSEDRVEEYLAAGHKLAVAPIPEKKPAKKTTKKSSKKK